MKKKRKRLSLSNIEDKDVRNVTIVAPVKGEIVICIEIFSTGELKTEFSPVDDCDDYLIPVLLHLEFRSMSVQKIDYLSKNLMVALRMKGKNKITEVSCLTSIEHLKSWLMDNALLILNRHRGKKK